MSEIVQYTVWVVRQFLSGTMDLDVFAENLGGIYIYAREHPEDSEANALASNLMNPYAQFSGGYVSAGYLRRELEDAIASFEPGFPAVPPEPGFATISKD